MRLHSNRLAYLATIVLAVHLCASDTVLAAEQPKAAEKASSALVTPPNFAKAADYSAKYAGRAVLVMVGGEVVFERYDHGWSAERAHPLASGTKSFTGVVAAAAVQDGLITWDEVASETLTEWKSDPRKSRITVRQLLSLSSGLDPSDAALGGRGGSRILGEGAADRARRLGTENGPRPQDLFKASLAVPTKHDPGERFEYGPSHFYAFGELLTRKLEAKAKAEPTFAASTFEKYMHARVLDPIGLKVSWFGRDAKGNPNLPGGCMLVAREWAKFGQLVLQNGSWKQADGTMKSIVDSRTLAECFKPSPANPTYGLTWWLRNGQGDPESSLIADGPVRRAREERQRQQNVEAIGPDGKPLVVYMAAGLGKQRLFVVPQYDMVIVRFAEATREGRQFEDQDFLRPILGLAAESASTKPKPD